MGATPIVFGRDGGLTKVDLLCQRIERRVMQAGNSIGGAISQDGRLVAVENYTPGGVKVFSADTLELLADIPAEYAEGKRAKVVGLADAPGNRFVFSLFEAGEIWVADLERSAPARDRAVSRTSARSPTTRWSRRTGATTSPACSAKMGWRCSTCGIPNAACGASSTATAAARRSCRCTRCRTCEGWALAGRHAYLPAIGRHEVLVVDTATLDRGGAHPGRGAAGVRHGAPGRPAGVGQLRPAGQRHGAGDRHGDAAPSSTTLKPGKAVLHLEFTPRGEAVWISARDDDRVIVYDTATFAPLAEIPADKPSGIFFTARAFRIGL